MIKKLVALLLCLSISGLSQAATKFMESGTAATQDLSFYALTAGTVTSATDQVHTGSRSLKLSTGAGPDEAYADIVYPSSVDAGHRISMYVRFDALPGSEANMIRFRNGSGSVFDVSLTDTGLLGLSTGIYGATALSVNTWYRITTTFTITSTSVYTIKVYLNGILEIQQSNALINDVGVTTVRLRLSSVFGTNVNLWFSDIYSDDVSDYSDTGDVRVTAKRPFSNGTVNGFSTQIGSGNSGYGSGHADEVNERPLSTTNGWSMVGAGSAVTEEYNIESASRGDVDISSGRFLDSAGWLYSSSLAPETAQIILNGATSNISLAGSALFTKFAGSAAYPAGTGADIGLITSTDLTTVSLYEAGVLVAYLPPFPRRQIIISEEQ